MELDWSLIGLWSLGLWSLGLYAPVELSRREIATLKLIMAGALLAFRSTMRDYRHSVEWSQTLRSMLGLAVRDEYLRRSKSSRDYPRKKRAILHRDIPKSSGR